MRKTLKKFEIRCFLAASIKEIHLHIKRNRKDLRLCQKEDFLLYIHTLKTRGRIEFHLIIIVLIGNRLSLDLQYHNIDLLITLKFRTGGPVKLKTGKDRTTKPKLN